MSAPGAEEAEEAERPVLRVVHGDPTPEELAALVVVLAAASSGAPSDAPGPVTRWGRPADVVRAPLAPGPQAWRTSAWTR